MVRIKFLTHSLCDPYVPYVLCGSIPSVTTCQIPSLTSSQESTLPMNIRFNYLYRDAGNYKQYGLVVFSNPHNLPLREVEQSIRSALIDGELFNDSRWQLPDLREQEWDDEMDHDWHEFESVKEIEGDGKTYPSIEDLLHRIKRHQEAY